MDHLTEVSRLAKKYEQAKAKMEEAMEARNAAIRVARAERYGPGAIGDAANLTAEQVRRIVQTEPGQATAQPRRPRPPAPTN
jgi:hypothetical protein